MRRYSVIFFFKITESITQKALCFYGKRNRFIEHSIKKSLSHSEQNKQKRCHYEPVTDVTGS